MVTAVLAVASLVVTLLRQPDNSGDDVRRRELQRQLDAMRQELRRVHGQQVVVLAAAGRPTSEAPSRRADNEGTVPIPAGRPGFPPDAEEAEEERRASAIEQADRRVALLDATLRGEGIDRPWAETSERSIRDASVSPELAGSSVESAECRSTMCRVHVLHESEQAGERFSGPFLTKLPNLPRGMVRRYPPAPDGRARSVVFLAREGHRLPVVEDR